MSNIFPLPPAPLFDAPRGRPGDWSEPADVDGLDRTMLDAEAARLRMPPDLLATLLVERELLLDDLASAGLKPQQAEALLDQASSGDGAALGPGNLHFGYVRDLRGGALGCGDSSVGRPLMLPLRLHEPLRRAQLCFAPPNRADQALRWEISSASEGLQMREWGLRIALGAR